MEYAPRGGRLIHAALAMLVISSCGGGGDASAPTEAPAAPVVSVSVGAKQLLLSWPPVSGASSYKVYANPEGITGLTQIGAEIITTSYAVDLPVHTFDWAGARYQVHACNSLGCTPSAEITAPGAAGQAIGYFKASAVDAFDAFGKAVAVSGDGNIVAVGAPLEDSSAGGINGVATNNDATDAGAVFVYVRASGGWALQAYIKAAVTDAGDTFGSAVALDADGATLAIGSPSEDSAATQINGDASDDSAPASGAVYVFTRSGITWTQQAYIKASNAGTGDTFGDALALSADGNTLAVGAWAEDGAGDLSQTAGAAYVYARNGGVWSEQAYLKASNTDPGDRFGIALALSDDGDTLAVGAVGEASLFDTDPADNSADGAGAVYVFTRNTASWTEQAYLKASDAFAQDAFGGAVTLSGDGTLLAVGATGEDSGSSGINGDQSGFDAAASGAVYLFARSTDSWSQQHYIKPSNTAASDAFGQSVAFDGNADMLIVTAPGEDSAASGLNGSGLNDDASDAGAAYVFARDDATWLQRSYLKAPNTAASAIFGWSAGIADDGRTIMIGATGEDSAATGVGGDQHNIAAKDAGAAYLY